MTANLSVALLAASVQLGTSASVLFTANKGANTGATIGRLTVANVGANASGLTLYLVPSGSSPSGTNTVVSNVTVAPGSQIPINEAIGLTVPNGYSLYAVASVATSLTVTVSGFTYVNS